MPVPVVSTLRPLLRRHPHLADLALGFAVAAFMLLVWKTAVETDPSSLKHPASLPSACVAAALIVLGIATRNFRPRLSILLAAVVFGIYSLITGGDDPGPQTSLIFSAYTVGLRHPRWKALAAAAGAVVITWIAEMFVLEPRMWLTEGFGTLLWVSVGLALGEAARNRRAFIAAIQERAQRAEQTREEEAQRRVIQERLRIARELHDVVAHHIAVINVQAGAVSHLLTRQPDKIAPAVLHIREACDTVLTELSSIVGVLRQPDDENPNEPAPGLQRLPELLQSMATVGHEVSTVLRGDPRDLPSVTDLAAYRIIQEALTNAHKYGTGRTDLEIRYESDRIEIRVSNPHDVRRTQQGSGYGLLGMSERVTAAAGSLQTRATEDGHFVVQVSMPTPQKAAS